MLLIANEVQRGMIRLSHASLGRMNLVIYAHCFPLSPVISADFAIANRMCRSYFVMYTICGHEVQTPDWCPFKRRPGTMRTPCTGWDLDFSPIPAKETSSNASFCPGCMKRLKAKLNEKQMEEEEEELVINARARGLEMEKSSAESSREAGKPDPSE